MNAFKIVIVLQLLYCECLTSEGELASRASGGSKQYKFVQWEIPFLEHAQELLSHCAAHTDYCNSHDLNVF